MNGERVLVTGGTGFLGKRVVAELLEHESCPRVRVVVRSERRAQELLDFLQRRLPATDRLELAPARLTSRDDCQRLLKDCDRVIHVAAAVTGSPASLFAQSVVPTRTLVAETAGTPVRRFVLVSSLAVYATNALKAGAILNESCGTDPQPHRRDAYTYSKVAQERVCWDAFDAAHLPLVVVRPGVIYGPGRSLITPRVGLRVGPVFVRLGGRHPLPYTYVDNCARAIVLSAFADGIDGRAFNVIDDPLPTGREILRLCSRRERGRVVGVPAWAIPAMSRLYARLVAKTDGLIPPVFVPYRANALWKPLKYPNATARRTLGWEPFVTTAEGLRRTIAANENDPVTRRA